MKNPVIVQALRTPIGRARKGSLVSKDAFELAQVVVRAMLERTRIEPSEIDDLIIAESLQGGGVIARHTAVVLGLDRVPGLATNRHCAAGLGAIATGAGSIAAGMDRVVLAGGTESLSSMPMLLKRPAAGADPQPWMPLSHPETPDAPAFDMSITVGHNAAVELGLSRADVDRWAIYSHGRAIESIDSGAFAAQLVPVRIEGPGGEVRLFETDEHPRRGLTLEGMAELKALHPEIDGFTVTAGNAAGLNDAAAAVMLADADYAASNGIEPLAAIRSWAAVGVAPRRTGLAPIDAIPKALARAGVDQGDIDLFEINEAFCSVAVATTRALGIDQEICNVNGSGCSLGHPIAATGARMVVTMVHELRRRGASLGCVSMCAGGGMGMAMVIEAL
ncbi:MAG TPA: thiolase family protein [Candidatus Dormibacteraeota bacterium]|nr:thiolase family protein [Candidatus Dormibacteraeota bacterium]